MVDMKPHSRCIKRTLALSKLESRALNWYAKRTNVRGLAPLRVVGLNVVVYCYTRRTR